MSPKEIIDWVKAFNDDRPWSVYVFSRKVGDDQWEEVDRSVTTLSLAQLKELGLLDLLKFMRHGDAVSELIEKDTSFVISQYKEEIEESGDPVGFIMKEVEKMLAERTPDHPPIRLEEKAWCGVRRAFLEQYARPCGYDGPLRRR